MNKIKSPTALLVTALESVASGDSHSTEALFFVAAEAASQLYGPDSCILALVFKEYSKFHFGLGNVETASALMSRANFIFTSHGVML